GRGTRGGPRPAAAATPFPARTGGAPYTRGLTLVRDDQAVDGGSPSTGTSSCVSLGGDPFTAQSVKRGPLLSSALRGRSGSPGGSRRPGETSPRGPVAVRARQPGRPGCR